MAKTEKDQGMIEFAKGLNNVPWCDDYEKMISGVLYNSMVPELVQGRFRARQFMHKFNNHFPEDATPESLSADKYKLLKGIMGRIGKDPTIEGPFSIDYGSNIIIGDSFYSNFNLVILDCSFVTIGNRVMCGPNVSIYAATHEVEVQSRRDYIEYAAPVVIGDDCWIGGGSTILPGVTIGKGCTIAAGSVVTRSIPDFSVAVGSPAKVVKKVTPVPDMPGDEGQTAHGSVVA